MKEGNREWLKNPFKRQKLCEEERTERKHGCWDISRVAWYMCNCHNTFYAVPCRHWKLECDVWKPMNGTFCLCSLVLNECELMMLLICFRMTCIWWYGNLSQAWIQSEWWDCLECMLLVSLAYACMWRGTIMMNVCDVIGICSQYLLFNNRVLQFTQKKFS